MAHIETMGIYVVSLSGVHTAQFAARTFVPPPPMDTLICAIIDRTYAKCAYLELTVSII